MAKAKRIKRLDVDKDRAFSACILPETVHSRRDRGWKDSELYTPSRSRIQRKGMCPCGCGNPPVRQIGARFYCAMTAIILGAP